MTIRVGLVGAGGIAGNHLQNLSENNHVNISAICDIVPENAEKQALRYGAAAYTDFDAMLQQEKLDALFVCVPPFAHGQIEEKAADRGIHLFVEKPVGLDMKTVRSKAEAIRRAGIIAGSGYCLRYLDTVAVAKTFLENRKIAMVRAHYLTAFVQTPWWIDMAKSGGQLVEQATHTVDLVRFLAGEVNKVYADMALLVMDDVPGIGIPDVGSVNLVFESGAIGHIDTCMIQPDHRTGVEILGRDFRVALNGASLTIVDNGETANYENAADVYKKQDDAFIEAIRSGRRELILAPYEEALKTLEITLAANDSSRSGMPVSLGG